MSSRPEIPAELRRRILVEAGHRCAIHTCRHPDVDVHHIVPWEICQEHAYDNLIALCPNCHRRAGAGEVDRKALRIYKARLAAAFGFDNVVAYEAVAASPLVEGYQTEVLNEANAGHAPFEVRCEYPKFREDTDDLRELNLLEHATALEQLVGYRQTLLEPEGSLEGAGALSFESSYVIALLSEKLISIRYSVFSYVEGAAHPNHGSRAVNYALEPLVRLSLASVFHTGQDFLQLLSEECIAQLRGQLGDFADEEWLLRGAGPKVENFETFNITPQGIVFTFDPYIVASYAAGTLSVSLKWEPLTHHLRPSTVRESILEIARGNA